MPAKSIELSRIKGRSELAVTLDAPISALDVVTLSSDQCCKTAGCSLSLRGAAQLKQMHSPLTDMVSSRVRQIRHAGCQSSWLRPVWSTFFAERHRTGCGVLLLLILTLRKLGYSHSGMFRFPNKPDQVATAARVLRLSASDRKRVADDPRRFYVAPWHYHPCHRARDADGKWSLRKLSTFKDSEGAVFFFAPPNSSVQAFIDEQSLSSGLMRGEVNDTLPPWFRTLERQQREAGGPSPAPLLLLLSPRSINVTPTSTPRILLKRRNPDRYEIQQPKAATLELQRHLNRAMQDIQQLT